MSILDQLEELEKSAAVTPWEYASRDHIRDGYADNVATVSLSEQGEANAEFIVAIRNIAPAFIAIVRAAQISMSATPWPNQQAQRDLRDALAALEDLK